MADPYCLAMVLCDGVHRDPFTGKFTILGTCSWFAADEFPTNLRFFLYSAITDGMGKVTLSMRLVTAEYSLQGQDDAGLLFQAKQNFDLESPLDVLESVLEIRASILQPGQYHCELFANDQLLMARRFSVFDAAAPGL